MLGCLVLWSSQLIRCLPLWWGFGLIRGSGGRQRGGSGRGEWGRGGFGPLCSVVSSTSQAASPSTYSAPHTPRPAFVPSTC